MMTRIERSEFRLSLLLATVLAAILPGAKFAAAAEAKDLASQVEIRRTEYGVPHIQADTLEAVAFGFGYCQAEDHLPNILRGIVGARGELALTFGADEKDAGDGKNLAADRFSRQFRIYKRAVDTYHKLDPDYRTMCEGFAAGINEYVARHPQHAPAWAPKVTGHDVVAYGMAGVMRFAFNRSKIIEGFLKEQGVETAAKGTAESLRDRPWHPGAPFGDWSEAEVGSNMWAFAPSRSRSGRALLMGNPHQPWSPVATYYEAHLIVPGRMNFYGSTFIGRPVLTSGWNEHLGWSHTVNYPDMEEIYELELDPDRPEHYLFDGGSVPLERDEVEIAVRDGSSRKVEKFTFWHTPLGPVIHKTQDKAFVLRSACWENYRAYEQWLKMTQTRSFDEFRKVVAMNQIPMFNICYADRAGNIYYLFNGTVPKLPHDRQTTKAIPAKCTADIWTDFLRTAELPQLVNPPGGYVQNCNSPPYYTNLKSLIDPEKFPLYLRENNVSLRTQHSLELIGGDDKLSLEEIRERKHSPRILVADRVKDALLAALGDSSASEEFTAASALLKAWDNTVQADSRGATLFVEWWKRYEKAGGQFAVAWNTDEPTKTPRGLADAELARTTFREAMDNVKRRFGAIDVAWGDTHRFRKGPVDLPLSGGSGLMGCFRVLDFQEDADGKESSRGGDSFVFMVEFSEPPRGYSVLAYSQSEIPSSPYYNDQAALFAAGKFKRAAFTDAEINESLVKKYRPGEE